MILDSSVCTERATGPRPAFVCRCDRWKDLLGRRRGWVGGARRVKCITLEPGGGIIFNSTALIHPARTGANQTAELVLSSKAYGMNVSANLST